MRGLTAREIERRAAGPVTDRVVLDYEGRFLRRRTLTTVSGASLFIDLPETVSLDAGDAFVTTDGARIAVEAAAEPLMEITAPPPDLVRFAWHIGNRHTPAQIEAGRLLIRADHVMADMLARLGAATRAVREPFTPERGAYGTGRVHGHHHGGATDDPDAPAQDARAHGHHAHAHRAHGDHAHGHDPHDH